MQFGASKHAAISNIIELNKLNSADVLALVSGTVSLSHLRTSGTSQTPLKCSHGTWSGSGSGFLQGTGYLMTIRHFNPCNQVWRFPRLLHSSVMVFGFDKYDASTRKADHPLIIASFPQGHPSKHILPLPPVPLLIVLTGF